MYSIVLYLRSGIEALRPAPVHQLYVYVYVILQNVLALCNAMCAYVWERWNSATRSWRALLICYLLEKTCPSPPMYFTVLRLVILGQTAGT